jgi:hypothetical protein
MVGHARGNVLQKSDFSGERYTGYEGLTYYDFDITELYWLKHLDSCTNESVPTSGTKRRFIPYPIYRSRVQ